MTRAILRTAAKAHWRHDATGRPLRLPANDNQAGYWLTMSEALLRQLMGEG